MIGTTWKVGEGGEGLLNISCQGLFPVAEVSQDLLRVT